MAVKYKYIVYCYLSPEGRAAGPEGWKELFEKEDELAEKHGVSILSRGIPFGVSETWVTVYETDKNIEGLMEMITETGRNKYVEAARTVTVLPFQWDR